MKQCYVCGKRVWIPYFAFKFTSLDQDGKQSVIMVIHKKCINGRLPEKEEYCNNDCCFSAEEFIEGNEIHLGPMQYEYEIKYCPWCGKKVKE